MTELQGRILDLLKLIDQLARKHGVEYYITGGSLIGAIRHRGFIPWDDDADIIMSRENWDKFYSCVKDELPEGYALQTQYDNPDLGQPIHHFTDTRTTEIFRFQVTHPEVTGVLIDVLVMDPVPDTEEAKYDYRKSVTELTDLSNLYYQYSLRVGDKSNFYKYWKEAQKKGKRAVFDEITKKAFHYPEEGTTLYAQRFAGAPHFWPKEFYGKPRYVPFEDTMLPVPERAGDCLSIGYDDDWFHIPRGGASKSTHEYCVRSFQTPCEYVLRDFEAQINRPEMMKIFLKRKKLWMEQTENRVQSELGLDSFAIARIRMIYEKKLAGVDVKALTESRDFEALQELFEEYIGVQCSSSMIGGSALSNWILWYRKLHPCLIDLGDDVLYAVLLLLMHNERLAWTGKLLKARELIDRPMTEELLEMKEIYSAVKSMLSHYECKEYNEGRSVLDECPEKWFRDIPFFTAYDLKYRQKEGLPAAELLEKTNAALEVFPDNDTLLGLQADALLELGRRDDAVEVFWKIVGKTDNGLVMLHMKDQVEELREKEGNADSDLEELYHEIQLQSGMEPEEESREERELKELKNEIESMRMEDPHNGEIEDLLFEFRRRISRTKNSLKAEDESEEAGEAAPEAEDAHEMNGIQKKRLELFTEFHNICKKNRIKYHLYGRTLAQAMRSGHFEDPNAEIEILMTTDNVKKFVECAKKEMPENRYIDSMAENPKFQRFCVRYCDRDSMDFNVTQISDKLGIFITIEVLRKESKNKFRNIWNQVLECGWEALDVTRRSYLKWTVSWLIVALWCRIAGRERVGRSIYARLMKKPKKADGSRLFRKVFWGKKVTYPSYYFDFTTSVTLEGRQFDTMRFSDRYLRSSFGPDWKSGPLPMANVDPFRRIIDPELPYEEYLDYLKRSGVQRDEIWKKWRKTNRAYAKIAALGIEIRKYWEIMCAAGERYHLAEVYQPQKKELQKLYHEGKDAELLSRMESYTDAVLEFAKQDLSLGVDPQLNQLSSYCLRRSNYMGPAEKVKGLLKKQKWNDISLYDEA